MTRCTQCLQIVPFQPPLPTFGGLNRFDMMNLDGQLCASFQSCLAFVLDRLQLCSTGHAPRLRCIESLVLRVTPAVVSTVSFPVQILHLAFPFRLPFCLGYRSAGRTVWQPVRYQLSTPRTRLEYSHVDSSQNENRPEPFGPSPYNSIINHFRVQFYAMFPQPHSHRKS